jgi:hypothetical protein
MKNLLIIFSLSLTFFISCQKEKSQEEEKVQEELASTFDSTALPTTTIDKSEELSFFFRYKFIPGETFRYRLTTISKSQQRVITDSTLTDNLEQTIIFILDFKTVSLDDDSVAELQCIFSSVNLKANANGQEISYKSDAQMDSSERSKFPEYESFLKNPFNLRVGKLGEIIDIYKIDKIMNRFLAIRGLTDSLTAQEKITAQQDLITRTIKPLLAQMFREFPDRKMDVDSSWSYKRESMPVMVFKIDYENKYIVDKLEMLGKDKLAVITGSIKTTVTGDLNHNDRGMIYKFEKPVSTATGQIYFNLSRGLVQKSRTQTSMQNAYSMEMPTPQGVKKANASEVTSNVNVIELL